MSRGNFSHIMLARSQQHYFSMPACLLFIFHSPYMCVRVCYKKAYVVWACVMCCVSCYMDHMRRATTSSAILNHRCAEKISKTQTKKEQQTEKRRKKTRAQEKSGSKQSQAAFLTVFFFSFCVEFSPVLQFLRFFALC